MAWLNQKARIHLRGIGQEEWVSNLDERVEIMTSLYGLREHRPLEGGRAGAVIRCVGPEGDSVILKILLPKDFPGQAEALRCMSGKGVCRLLHSEPSLLGLVLEDLGGTPHPGDEVDLKAVSDILKQWQTLDSSPRLPSIVNQLHYWESLVREGLLHRKDQEVMGHLQWALHAAEEEQSTGVNGLLHADLGYHNLLVTDHGMKIIDPTGAIGPLACDVGSLAIWGGFSIMDAPSRCLVLAEMLNLPLSEVKKWAAIRASFSAAFGSVRDDQKQRTDCLSVKELLLDGS